MKAKPILVTIVAVAALVGVALVAYRWDAPRRPALCQVCDRVISKQTAFRVNTSSGVVNACCPACAMHYMLHHPDAVQKAWATDFNSGRMIPAASAYFDEGGDVQYCTRHNPPIERGAEGVSERVYDRCLPTLVAFSTREEADAYRQQHGGRIVSYDEALGGLKGQ
jgi:hypothetical protein